MNSRATLFWLLLLPIFLINMYQTFIDPGISATIDQVISIIPMPIKIIGMICWIVALLYLFPYRRRK